MSVGRVVSSVVSCAAVAGCAVVVVGMTRATSAPTAGDRAQVSASPSATERPAYLPRTDAPSSTAPATTAAAPSPTAVAPSTSTAVPPPTTSVPVPVASSAPARVAVAPAPTLARTTQAPAPVVRPAATTTAPRPAAPKPAPTVAGQALPLRYTTGNATRVVTVTATSSRSTRATLQAWTKVASNRWQRYGSAITANVGADGIGSASETTSKTPAGSWTLTQAFGRNSNPGTGLPYVKTTPSDYWISSPGRLYNTRQRCASCGYDNGVNERLYYETPFYNYAVVIDYNTRNAPGGVKPGRGSAFFLHVSVGSSTAGCVAIPSSRLVSLMRWLSPAAHPRILIGVV